MTALHGDALSFFTSSSDKQADIRASQSSPAVRESEYIANPSLFRGVCAGTGVREGISRRNDIKKPCLCTLENVVAGYLELANMGFAVGDGVLLVHNSLVFGNGTRLHIPTCSKGRIRTVVVSGGFNVVLTTPRTIPAVVLFRRL
eukprot:9491880-Pyramimonas_sp.AAC.1